MLYCKYFEFGNNGCVLYNYYFIMACRAALLFWMEDYCTLEWTVYNRGLYIDADATIVSIKYSNDQTPRH